MDPWISVVVFNEFYFINYKLEELILDVFKNKNIKPVIKNIITKNIKISLGNVDDRFFLDVFFNIILLPLNKPNVYVNDEKLNIDIDVIRINEEINEYLNDGKHNEYFKMFIDILHECIFFINCIRGLIKLIFSNEYYDLYGPSEDCLKYTLISNDRHFFAYVCDVIGRSKISEEDNSIEQLIISSDIIFESIKRFNINIEEKEKELKHRINDVVYLLRLSFNKTNTKEKINL